VKNLQTADRRYPPSRVKGVRKARRDGIEFAETQVSLERSAAQKPGTKTGTETSAARGPVSAAAPGASADTKLICDRTVANGMEWLTVIPRMVRNNEP
jgi:hypothetical protein